MKTIFLLVLLSSCSTLVKNDDGSITEKSTFFGKTMHFFGDILVGMGGGLSQASSNIAQQPPAFGSGTLQVNGQNGPTFHNCDTVRVGNTENWTCQ